MNERQLAILVVDDDPDIVSGITRILRLDGYRVDAVASIAEMADRENWSDYFAILMDRKLPDGLAEDVLPQLVGLAPDAALIIVTGHADLDSSIAALRHGAEDYLLKPINPDALRAILARIAERKRTEQALRESEQRMRAILKAAPDAIITIGTDGVIRGFNPAAEQMFGYSADESIGENVSLLMPSPYREQHDEYLRRYLSTGDARIIGTSRELTGRRKDGLTFPIELSVSEVDHLGIFTGVIRDISERKRLQKEVLNIAAEEDRRIGHELHEGIQQEVTALELFAGTLLDVLRAVEQREFDGKETRLLEEARFLKLQEIAHKLCKGLADTHEHVQQLSRGIMPVPIDAQGLISALMELASSTDALQDITCRFESPEVVQVADNTTATHLYRIAQEAMNNALRHSQADGILLSLVRKDNQIILEVSDNGIGIDPVITSRAGVPGGLKGIGLRAMQYRAGVIGATLHIGRRDEGGTQVRCIVFSREGLR